MLATLLRSSIIMPVAASRAREVLQRTLSNEHGCLCSLTDPPQDGSTLHLTADIISQRGNALDVAQHVVLGPREQFFTAATYGVQYTTVVNITGVLCTLPHGAQLQVPTTALSCCLSCASQPLAAEAGVSALIHLMEVRFSAPPCLCTAGTFMACKLRAGISSQVHCQVFAASLVSPCPQGLN